MRRIILLFIVCLSLTTVTAQPGTLPELGDPPVAALITISNPDSNGIVTITGEAGATLPNGGVAIRNLYTEQTVYVATNFQGSFTARIYGPGNTPFWISPTRLLTFAEDQGIPGSLPGGPGTIKFGSFDQPPIETATAPITQLEIDGEVDDWLTYSNTLVVNSGAQQTVYALRNRASLYIALGSDALDQPFAQVEVTAVLDGVTYLLAFDPTQARAVPVQRGVDGATEVGTIAVGAARAAFLELRIPLDFAGGANTLTLQQLRLLDANGGQLRAFPVQISVRQFDEVDGIFRADSRLRVDGQTFNVAGPLGAGASFWSAQGRFTSTRLREPGEQWPLELDVTLNFPNVLPLPAPGVRYVGRLSLQPVAAEIDGDIRLISDLHSNNGWSSALTPSGLPIDNLRTTISVSETSVPPAAVIRGDDQLRFPLDFAPDLPEDLPPGLYVPILEGFVQFPDGRRVSWAESDLFGAGPGISRVPLTRLPLVLNVGEVEPVRLLWTLFWDHPSDGSRGVLSDTDQAVASLSNRVQFTHPTHILPPLDAETGTPITYPLEPYLINVMPNAYDSSTAPLIPFLFPGGRLTITVTRPDGSVDDLGDQPVLQNQLSTVAADERAIFGAQTPVDTYRLTTLNPLLAAYPLDQYGEYAIDLTGRLEDRSGNIYEGGGTYRVLVAELLDVLPAVLPGTPFVVGDAFNPAVQILPGVPAQVEVDVRVFPLRSGPVIERQFNGAASRNGYFHPGTDAARFIFRTPGEYIVDYEVRFNSPDGRLWAASLRTAGVIADDDRPDLVVHGERGLRLDDPDAAPFRPAWFDLGRYAAALGIPEIAETPVILNTPYHSGDVIWVEDGPLRGVGAALTGQDLDGAYADWLLTADPAYVSPLAAPLAVPLAEPIERLAALDTLPLAVINASAEPDAALPLLTDDAINEGYFYVSAVRPDVSVRQFVAGGYNGGLPLAWDSDDPLLGQIGAGLDGNRPGDYIFMFGGAVLRNTELRLRDSAIYAALAVTVPEPERGSPALSRVYPPLSAASGSGDSGPLLTVNNEPVDLFFHPTGVRPGAILRVGDALAISGQVGPPLPAAVTITITPPGQPPRVITGRANAVGHYFDAAQTVEVDTVGLWTVDVEVAYAGSTAAGIVDSPAPTGGVLGGGPFVFYVLPVDSGVLLWDAERRDTTIQAVRNQEFEFVVPADWTSVRAHYTLSTPSYLIEQGTLPITGNRFEYIYNPAEHGAAFPNIEFAGIAQESGEAVADTRLLTFVVIGLDANGRTQTLSRTFTIRHDRQISLD
ncbi:MAG: hypothetical protein GYB67_17975 [Chloroflexi bacterium]|nr:hypothetical protein [Chloroflexota bacterium]